MQSIQASVVHALRAVENGQLGNLGVKNMDVNLVNQWQLKFPSYSLIELGARQS